MKEVSFLDFHIKIHVSCWDGFIKV
jgi:hypothetical protein